MSQQYYLPTHNTLWSEVTHTGLKQLPAEVVVPTEVIVSKNESQNIHVSVYEGSSSYYDVLKIISKMIKRQIPPDVYGILFIKLIMNDHIRKLSSTAFEYGASEKVVPTTNLCLKKLYNDLKVKDDDQQQKIECIVMYSVMYPDPTLSYDINYDLLNTCEYRLRQATYLPAGSK